MMKMIVGSNLLVVSSSLLGLIPWYDDVVRNGEGASFSEAVGVVQRSMTPC